MDPTQTCLMGIIPPVSYMKAPEGHESLEISSLTLHVITHVAILPTSIHL